MEKILIVEDDPAIAEIERDYLEIDHFQVEIAPDGISGLNRGLSGAGRGIAGAMPHGAKSGIMERWGGTEQHIRKKPPEIRRILRFLHFTTAGDYCIMKLCENVERCTLTSKILCKQ